MLSHMENSIFFQRFPGIRERKTPGGIPSGSARQLYMHLCDILCLTHQLCLLELNDLAGVESGIAGQHEADHAHKGKQV